MMFTSESNWQSPNKPEAIVRTYGKFLQIFRDCFGHNLQIFTDKRLLMGARQWHKFFLHE
jgi:hypothetical protein